jgi:hypothetical protein
MHVKQKLFAWRVYKALHPLLRFRKMSPDMVTFIKNNITVGNTISIDSFPHTLAKEIQIDKIVELTNSQIIWNKLNVQDVSFIDSYDNVVDSIQYNNIILAGLTEFRYRTVAECAAVISKLVPILKQNGHIIATIPITTLLYHRLKFSYDQVIDDLNFHLVPNGLTITNRLLDIDIFYITVAQL